MQTRQYPRAKIKWPVVMKTSQGSKEGVTLNISPAGVFIRCYDPLRLNEVFVLNIKVPDSDRILKAKAEVVWSNIYGPDDEITPRGMGVRFVKISDGDRKFIAKVVLDHLKSQKVEPKLLRTLSTLIIDLGEVDSDIEYT